MRYLETNYTIEGQNIILEHPVSVNNVRVIIDEISGIVICSSMQKSNITTSGNTISVDPNVAVLDSSHDYTIALDYGDGISELDQKIGNSTDTSSSPTIFGKLSGLIGNVAEWAKNMWSARVEANDDEVGEGNEAYTIVLPLTAQVDYNEITI